MRIGITGAGGQVGSQLVSQLQLIQPNLQVVAVCRSTFWAKRFAGTGCEVRVGSLLDIAQARAMLADCDAVVHCAISGENQARPDSPNLAMIRTMRKAGVDRLIFMSTVTVYSTCLESGINTFSEPRPSDDYGRDKLICERAVLEDNGDRHNFVLRMGHVYGAYLNWSRRLLQLSSDPRFRLPFDGQLSSNAVRIDRVSQAIVKLLRGDEPGVYNLIDDPGTTWRQVFDWHTRVCGLTAVEPLGEKESQSVREYFVGLKRVTLARARREIGTAAISAVKSLWESSPLLKSVIRGALYYTPHNLELGLRRKRLAGIVAGAFAARNGRNVWEPTLSPLLSDAVPGRNLNYAETIAPGPRVEIDLEKAMSSWYRGWSLPDGPWRSV